MIWDLNRNYSYIWMRLKATKNTDWEFSTGQSVHLTVSTISIGIEY